VIDFRGLQVFPAKLILALVEIAHDAMWDK
jgi:hypothetical protein